MLSIYGWLKMKGFSTLNRRPYDPYAMPPCKNLDTVESRSIPLFQGNIYSISWQKQIIPPTATSIYNIILDVIEKKLLITIVVAGFLFNSPFMSFMIKLSLIF